mmetsp:Transcript_2361/g.9141  ORF Transcript_2361/g.9141 Transcript_2361/m.9141 type:complete len:84 (+) Transcript_2361:832-1083(+)
MFFSALPCFWVKMQAQSAQVDLLQRRLQLQVMLHCRALLARTFQAMGQTIPPLCSHCVYHWKRSELDERPKRAPKKIYWNWMI